MTVPNLKKSAVTWYVDDAPEWIAPGIARFRSPLAKGPPAPSIALAEPVEPNGERVHAEFRPVPRFARDGTGRPLVRIDTEPTVSLYGTGEVAGPLRRNGARQTMWNTDSFGYDRGTSALYQSQPWVMGVREDGSSFGVLVDSTYRLEVDLTDGVFFTCAGGDAPPVYVVSGEGPEDVMRALTRLIGPLPLPPLWSLGFHQCRYSYLTQERVVEVAREFRARRMPCDAIWCDIDYMRGYRVFTHDPETFPDPGAMARTLAQMGMRVVYILDPGIKIDPGYEVYDSGIEGDHFVREADGELFRGSVWPGVCHFPDFLSARTREWWSAQCAAFAKKAGASGLWTDMNEPAVFDTPGHTMSPTARHHADADLGGPDAHERYHNTYGMQMARATQDGLRHARPEKRPFVLSRANFLGGQRHAACWTGDSVSSWEHLSFTTPMALNMSLSGQPFVGCDIGGFSKNSTPELFARWMGLGCLLPFARAHSDKDTADHEPWAFGEACERASRLALERRYRLLPYLYTLFHEQSRDGQPPMRPLFFADPSDLALREAEDSFLLGAGLLVRGSVREDNARTSPVPRGRWLRFEPAPDALGATNPHLPDLMLRAGVIVPMGPVIQHTGEYRLDPLTLVVCLNDEGEARGTLYEDSGDGHGHLSGDYLYTTYYARREGPRVVVGIERAEGQRPRPARAAEILILREDGRSPVRAAGFGGDTIPVLMPE